MYLQFIIFARAIQHGTQPINAMYGHVTANNPSDEGSRGYEMAG